MDSSRHVAAPLLNWCDDERIFSCHNGVRRTRKDFAARVSALSRAIEELDGVGDRIAVLAQNSDVCFEVMLAATASGCTVCPLNWRWSKNEMAHAVQLCQPRVLFYDAACSEPQNHLHQTFPDIIFITIDSGPPTLHPSSIACSEYGVNRRAVHTAGQSVEKLIRAYIGSPLTLKAPAHGTAFVCFTSGTTGLAKGVMVSHASLYAQSRAKIEVLGLTHHDVYLHTAPLFHIGGISSALASLLAGAQQIFSARFEPALTAKLLQMHQVTYTIAVPMMLSSMTDIACSSPKIDQITSLKTLLVGAGALDTGVLSRTAELFPRATIYTAYGMTEAASSLTFLCLRHPSEPIAVPEWSAMLSDCAHDSASHTLPYNGVCVGHPAPAVQIKVDAARLTDSPDLPDIPEKSSLSDMGIGTAEAGIPGEVMSCGPHIMAGYWSDEKATESALTPDGWLRTGDIGWFDRYGRLWLGGRLKDVIKSGGENVPAADVEAALQQVPSILAAAVVGLPHPGYGESVAALLQLRESSQPTWEAGVSTKQAFSDKRPADIHALSSERTAVTGQPLKRLQQLCIEQGLASFKLPRVVVVQFEPLPTTSSGKIAKAQVRAIIQAAQTPIRSRL